ncbi:AGRD2 protein, partial [Rhinopomastus cyanomelas]|nr:AGRD2 protein [Rhinopomastus cyanomelas]
VDWWHADRHCQQRFAQLLLTPQDSEEAALGRLLQSHHVRGSLWLNERDGVLHGPRRRRNRAAPVLVFGAKTATRHAKVLSEVPALPAVTACAHLQWDASSGEVGTIFSYAVPAIINEFQLRGFADEEGFVRFALIVHEHHSPYLPVFRADGHWHHFCVNWQQNGSWALYADGQRRASASGLCAPGPSAPQPIQGQGVFVVGQDQDSLGGSFREKESFSGNITGLHVWRRVLSAEQVEQVRSCWALEQDLVFGWSSDALEVESSIREVPAQFLCPGPVEQCRVFEAGGGRFGSTACSQPLPFVCRYRKGAYRQLQRARLRSGPSLGGRVNVLAGTTVIPEGIFTSDVQDMNLSVALDALGALATVLREGEAPVLEPSDLLAVLHLLQRVSDVEAQGGEELELLEPLGQRYAEVTALILAEQNAGAWSSVSQVVRGPMAAVELCDRVMSHLAQLLSAGRPRIAVRHGNVGLHRVTVKNMWFGYSSLQRCLSGPGHRAGSQDVAAPDGGQKVLATSVGTAIISSALLSGHQEIRTSVRYHLQHRVQVAREGLCCPLLLPHHPDAGGMWSTAGCSVVTSLPASTACFCNHTTNFAVLLQVHELQQRTAAEELALQTLTFAGCGVSFCALVTTFVLFSAVGVPKSERTTVHKNLVFALAAAEALLMVSGLAKAHQVLCFMVTAFLHLFFMAAFTWMLVEGLLLWSKVVAVNMSEDRRMKFYYGAGWGLPVVIVAVTLAAASEQYVAADHCWLNARTSVIWAFVGPALCILAVNTFVLCRVVMVTVASARRRSKMLTPNSSLESQLGTQIWATAKPVLVLLPVLGLTWVCGVLVHLSIVWAYVFIALNSLQGLYIFLVYAVYNSEVRGA